MTKVGEGTVIWVFVSYLDPHYYCGSWIPERRGAILTNASCVGFDRKSVGSTIVYDDECYDLNAFGIVDEQQLTAILLRVETIHAFL